MDFEQVPGTDPAAALRAFLELHPLSRHVRRCNALPAGWRRRLGGALSQ